MARKADQGRSAVVEDLKGVLLLMSWQRQLIELAIQKSRTRSQGRPQRRPAPTRPPAR
jgi:hypothetical protein